MTASKFLNWEDGELWEIEVQKLAKRSQGKKTTADTWRKLKLPAVYVQLIYQLLAEDRHGNDNDGYEALRRQSYARQVLDQAAMEIREYTGAAKDFRSAILTPILQRYLWGIPDSYTPVICAAVAKGNEEPTLADATKFYLRMDPVDHTYLPQYRRNLLYIAESRWYLGTLLDNFDVTSDNDFNKTRINHDAVMESIANEANEDDEDEDEEEEEDDEGEDDEGEEDEDPHPFNETEIRVSPERVSRSSSNQSSATQSPSSHLSPLTSHHTVLQPELLQKVKAEQTKKRARSDSAVSGPLAKRIRSTSLLGTD